MSTDPSGYVIVAVPSFPTSTLVPSGNLSLFASSIAFLTASFSVCVKLDLSATGVLAGTVGSVFSAVVGAFSSTKSVPLIVSFDPSGYVIVAVPSFPTSTLVPSGNLSLFASSIAFLTASFSVCVKLDLSATGVLAGTVGSIESVCFEASFQTAYTVVGSVSFVTSITSASLASAVFAQPTNSFPSNFGSAGLFTPSFISSVFVVELSSNLPPLASNVTSFSSV